MKTIASLVLSTLSAWGALTAPALAADWNAPQQPFLMYGNTHYVGTAGISAVLITSPQGHILIDGAAPKGAQLIAANIRSLGFKPEDIKYILNSHAHIDHAGGIAELQKISGATVLAAPPGVQVLGSGKAGPDDPQFGTLSDFTPVANLRPVLDGEVVKLGPLAVTAHYTPGHTKGGASWTWQSCEAGLCKNVVYGDSLGVYSADGYKYTAHPEVVADFERSFKLVEALPCDLLITAHPEVNDMWGRLARQPKQGNAVFQDDQACRALVVGARKALAARLAFEQAKS
ncbi:MAG: SMB-1 family subclass B3 metallo-beta-lactamase [Pseudomonadota bacterium]